MMVIMRKFVVVVCSRCILCLKCEWCLSWSRWFCVNMMRYFDGMNNVVVVSSVLI